MNKMQLLVTSLVLGLAGAHRADADNRVTDSLAYGFYTGGVYAGVTGAMVIHDVATDHSGLTYSIAETAWNLPCAVAWGNSLRYDLDTDRDGALVDGALMAVHIALVAHSVYSIIQLDREASTPPATFQVGSVHATVTPTATAGGGGLGLVGSF